MRKRRAKLVTATEEAFAHIKRMSADQMKGDNFMDITLTLLYPPNNTSLLCPCNFFTRLVSRVSDNKQVSELSDQA